MSEFQEIPTLLQIELRAINRDITHWHAVINAARHRIEVLEAHKDSLVAGVVAMRQSVAVEALSEPQTGT